MGLLLERKLCGVRGQGLCVKDMPALRQVSIFRSLKPFPCLPISMYASVSKDTKTRFVMHTFQAKTDLRMLTDVQVSWHKRCGMCLMCCMCADATVRR